MRSRAGRKARKRPARSGRGANRKTSHAGFARALLAWYDAHGRKDLPWKRPGDPYAVWVSEIMLQQTQVATVIPYYTRFLERFPNVRALARAPLDDVLHLWTGLGYYARARHLRAAAQKIVCDHRGIFPRDLDAVMQLPGIGRSTAGAILALAFGQRQPILDGNVKRVLTRYRAIGQPVKSTIAEQQLWDLAERYTPATRVADYTQAIMDLGATVCRRREPACASCPVAAGCAAHAEGRPEHYPVATKRKARPVRRVKMLMIQNRNRRVLLLRRPPSGIWGGLWSFPECRVADVRAYARKALGLSIAVQEPLPVLRHAFSHFDLVITPVPARLVGDPAPAVENGGSVWYNVAHSLDRGVSTPVKKLLEQLTLRNK